MLDESQSHPFISVNKNEGGKSLKYDILVRVDYKVEQ